MYYKDDFVLSAQVIHLSNFNFMEILRKSLLFLVFNMKQDEHKKAETQNVAKTLSCLYRNEWKSLNPFNNYKLY